MKRLLIAFGHKRRRGKDVAAQHLVHDINRIIGPCRSDFFAKSLKEGICKHVFGLTDDQLYGEAKTVVDPFWGLTPREIFQRAGTEAMRNKFGEDIWVKTLVRRLRNDPKTHVVISDLRFPNEAQAVKDHGGYLVRIDRDVEYKPGEDDHYSETALDDFNGWDFVLKNDGTVSKLLIKVSTLLSDNIHMGL